MPPASPGQEQEACITPSQEWLLFALLREAKAGHPAGIPPRGIAVISPFSPGPDGLLMSACHSPALGSTGVPSPLRPGPKIRMPHPARKATPPSGVIAPSLLKSVRARA